MKTPLPFIFKHIFHFFEGVALVFLFFVIIFLYQNFYLTTTADVTETLDPTQVQQQTINVGLYQTVSETHAQKNANASIFEGYIVSNPFEEPEKDENSEETLPKIDEE